MKAIHGGKTKADKSVPDSLPLSPEVRMVVPAHQLPLPMIVLTHAEGRVFQYQKMMGVIEQLRTDLLPRHHAAYQHAQKGTVRDDEQFPLQTLRKMVQCFESALLE